MGELVRAPALSCELMDALSGTASMRSRASGGRLQDLGGITAPLAGLAGLVQQVVAALAVGGVQGLGHQGPGAVVGPGHRGDRIS